MPTDSLHVGPHPAVALAKTLLDEGYDIHFSSARPLLWEIRETWGSREERESETIQRRIRHDLLILDEVSMQFESDAECLLLFDALSGRYEELKLTVLISNLTVDALPDYLNFRLLDRLRENGGVVVPFTWPSARGLRVVA